GPLAGQNGSVSPHFILNLRRELVGADVLVELALGQERRRWGVQQGNHLSGHQPPAVLRPDPGVRGAIPRVQRLPEIDLGLALLMRRYRGVAMYVHAEVSDLDRSGDSRRERFDLRDQVRFGQQGAVLVEIARAWVDVTLPRRSIAGAHGVE